MKLPLLQLTISALFLVNVFQGVCEDAIPAGFRVNPIGVTGQIVRKVNSEAQSTNRLEYVRHYAKMLSSSNNTNRLFAAWALGDFPSPQALDALFLRAKIENDDQVIKVLADSVGRLTLGCLPDAYKLSDGLDGRTFLERSAKFYSQYGYVGVFAHQFHLVKDNFEAEAMLIRPAAELYAPDLIPFFQTVIKESSFSEIQTTCTNAVKRLTKIKLLEQPIKPNPAAP
jgi:hypothetical protein